MSGNNWVNDSSAPEPVPAPPEPQPVPPTPTPQPNSGDYTVEGITKMIVLISQFADTAKTLIPGEVDDKVISVLQSLTSQSWFAPLLVMLLNMTHAQREVAIRNMGPQIARTMNIPGV